MLEGESPFYQGSVICDRIVHFRSQEKDPKTGEKVSKAHPVRKGFLNINVCSNSPKWKGLSPMILGPVRFAENRRPLFDYPDGILPGCKAIDRKLIATEALIFENFWQASKIYDIDLDKNGYIKKSFFERRAKFFKESKGHRRTIPKAKGHPVAAYFNGWILNYLESRPIYCYMYEKLASQTEEYELLKGLLEDGNKLQILGFDGQQMSATPENLECAYRDPVHPWGHELTLCCMLIGFRPWILELETYSWLNRIVPKIKPKVNLSGTTRVRIRRKGDKIVQDCDVYIGRRWNLGGWDLEASPFANPFRVKEYPNEDVVAMYREHILSKPKLLKQLPELRGKILGCFCELTDKCHGDVLIELLEELETELIKVKGKCN